MIEITCQKRFKQIFIRMPLINWKFGMCESHFKRIQVTVITKYLSSYFSFSVPNIYGEHALMFDLCIFRIYILDCTLTMLSLRSIVPSSQGFIDLPSFYYIPSTHWVFRLHTMLTGRRCITICIVSNIGNLENKLFIIQARLYVIDINLFKPIDIQIQIYIIAL